MLDDLMDLSDAYASENREMTRKGHQGNLVQSSPVTNSSDGSVGISYEESRTSQHQDAILRQGQGPQDMYTQDRYPPSDPYTMASAQAGYPALSTSTYPPSQGYPAAYPPDPGFAQASAYGAPYQIPGGRPAPNNDYGYGGESPRRDQYGQPVAYQNSVRRGDPRVDPGKSYPGPDSRERVDREPRNLDPRIPSSYTASTGGYTSVYSPGNVDPGYDDYVSAAPRTQSSRPVDPYQQSRPAPAGYDPRDPRYRPEPFREEPRRTGGRR